MLSNHSYCGFTPSCTVVICTRDRPEHLERCLGAVSRLDYSPFEVLVVDNASRNGRSRDVAARWNARYIFEPVAGLSRARNIAARACNTEIVALLDDDAVPERGLAHCFSTGIRRPNGDGSQRVELLPSNSSPKRNGYAGYLGSGTAGALTDAEWIVKLRTGSNWPISVGSVTELWRFAAARLIYGQVLTSV